MTHRLPEKFIHEWFIHCGSKQKVCLRLRCVKQFASHISECPHVFYLFRMKAALGKNGKLNKKKEKNFWNSQAFFEQTPWPRIITCLAACA